MTAAAKNKTAVAATPVVAAEDPACEMEKDNGEGEEEEGMVVDQEVEAPGIICIWHHVESTAIMSC